MAATPRHGHLGWVMSSLFSVMVVKYTYKLLSDLPASRASLESNNHFELLHAFNCHSPVKHNFAQLSVALQSISSTSYPRATSQPVGLLSVAQNLLKANSCTAAEKEKLVGCNT